MIAKQSLTKPGFKKASAMLISAALVSSNPLVAGFSSSSVPADSSCEAQSLSTSDKIRVIPNSNLYVSEPDPSWFGNPQNPSSSSSESAAWTNSNWLKSRFHFSFAEYSNQKNTNFGVLRVMNDDLVQPKRGFGTHPHGNMEILTYVVNGELTHKDSTGTQETLGRGSVQFMTAGTGIRHSERNNGDQPLRFIQTWIVPDQRGLKPNYGSLDGSTCKECRRNKWQHIVSNINDSKTATPVEIHQDLDGYVTELELGASVNFNLEEGRQAYLLCVEGEVLVNGKKLERHDGCEIKSGSDLEIEATKVEDSGTGQVAHLLMYTMQEVEGSGRTDVI